jgi:filamentous hemagglutinin family protein
MKSERFPFKSLHHVLQPTGLLLWAVISLLFSLPLSHAQVTQTPGAGGLNTQVNHIGSVYEITHGTPAGSNLFLSFDSFSITAAETARFQTPNLVPDGTTGNILGRVTGGNVSSIFGTVDSISYYPNANLFLMNPNGIIFGPSAQINVGGMATFTTANYLRLWGAGTNDIFYADPAQPSLLTSAPVATFGFLGSNPAAISLQGSTLSVQTNQSLALVGGDHGFTYSNPDTGLPTSVPGGTTVTGGSLLAPSGEINIASVASAGEISAGDFMPTSGMTMGDIALSQGATLDVSGDGGGTIKIVGGQFVADQAFLNANTFGTLDGAATAVDINMTDDVTFTNGSAITLSAGGTGRLGDITIDGRNLTFDGLSSITAINFDSANDGGSITTTSQTLNILGGATWFAATFGSANSGTIEINASESVVVSGDLANGLQSSIQNQSFGVAASGDITIATRNAAIDNLGIIGTDSALGQGGAIRILGYLTPQAEGLSVLGGSIIGTTGGDGSGAIIINAKDVTVRGQPDLTSRIQSIGFGAGGTGSILMPQTEQLVVADNARINLEVEDGNLNESSIVISASNSVTLSNDAKIRMEGGGGGALDLSSPTILIDNQSAIQTIAGSSGDSTGILVKTDNLTLSGQSQINSSTLEAALGKGGSVTIQGLASPANSVTIDGLGSGIVTETNGEGAGGSITAWANQVLLSDGATVSAKTTSLGNAGNILVKADAFIMNGGATITAASTGAGNGGTITIQGANSPAQSVLIDDAGSGIFTTTEGTGTGGNIFVNANSITMTNDSSVSASSTGPGNTGNIQINAGNQFAMTNSSVTTEATQAGGGAIKITTEPSGTVQLTNSRISASVLDGTGGGGSVDIDPQFVILQNSQILAQAVQGAGGNISITTNLLLQDANSVISASSQFGVNGTVTIQSPNNPAGGKIQPLGKSPLLATSLLNQHCAALADGEFSSFTVTGRNSLPIEPSGWLSSPLVVGQDGFSSDTVTEKDAQAGVIDPVQETTLLSLRQIAPVGFLTQAFALDWSASCQS